MKTAYIEYCVGVHIAIVLWVVLLSTSQATHATPTKSTQLAHNDTETSRHPNHQGDYHGHDHHRDNGNHGFSGHNPKHHRGHDREQKFYHKRGHAHYNKQYGSRAYKHHGRKYHDERRHSGHSAHERSHHHQPHQRPTLHNHIKPYYYKHPYERNHEKSGYFIHYSVPGYGIYYYDGYYRNDAYYRKHDDHHTPRHDDDHIGTDRLHRRRDKKGFSPRPKNM